MDRVETGSSLKPLRRGLALTIALGAATIGLSCATGIRPERVLRVEYATAPSDQGDVETGVVFWRSTDIARDELPADLIEKLGSTFPIVFQLERRLANTCFANSTGFGLTSMKRGETTLSGPFWRTADAGWTVNFTLKPNRTVLGTTGYYFSSGGSAEPQTLTGSWREVANFAECFEKVRAAPSRTAPNGH